MDIEQNETWFPPPCFPTSLHQLPFEIPIILSWEITCIQKPNNNICLHGAAMFRCYQLGWWFPMFSWTTALADNSCSSAMWKNRWSLDVFLQNHCIFYTTGKIQRYSHHFEIWQTSFLFRSLWKEYPISNLHEKEAAKKHYWSRTQYFKCQLHTKLQHFLNMHGVCTHHD